MSRFVFIDPRVQDLEHLLVGLAADVQVVVLEPAQDGVEQIADALANVTNLESVHIVLHGSSGSLYLGSSVLTEEGLDSYRVELSRIGSALSEEGDILLYGCDVGAGITGANFIEKLSAYTDADVAVSVDATGGTVAGGDWVLEESTGMIEAPVLLDAAVLESYSYTLSASGTLDLSFSTTETGSGEVYVLAIATQADGKIITTGQILNGATYDIHLVRYNVSGGLDSSFGEDGIVTTAIGSNADWAGAVTVQPDGKILVAGLAQSGSNNDFALLRYNTDGTLDNTFSGDGFVTIDLGAIAYEYFKAVVMQPDGRILAGGATGENGAIDFALMRFGADGTLDTSFSDDGILTTSIGGNDELTSIALQADGKIVAVGSQYLGGPYDIALARYNADGTLDTSFSGDGILIDSIGPEDYMQSVLIQVDGKIVVAGFIDISSDGSDHDFALARYNADGSRDTTFDGDGIVTTAFGTGNDRLRSAVLQDDGKIVVSGDSDFGGGNIDVVIARYNTDGSLDTSFDGDGWFSAAMGSGNDAAMAVTLGADGSVVFGGYGSSGSFVGLIRGTPGDDSLVGGSGDETILGLAGNDTLNGGGGLDTMEGDTGSDVYFVDNAGDVVVETSNSLPGALLLPGGGGGGAGLLASPLDGITDLVNAAIDYILGNYLENLTLIGDALAGTGNTLANALEGNDLGNVLLSLDGNDTVDGLGGDDSLDGGAGSDTLNGGAGADTLDGGTGVDTLIGGEGGDTYVMRATATGGPGGIAFVYEDVISETGVDADTVYSNSSHTLTAGMENLTLTGAPLWRAYVGTGNGGDNTLTGQGAARQRLYGEGGNDTLDGGGGRDVLDGGAGDDVLVYDALDSSINGGAGTDTLRLDASGVSINLAGIAGTVIQNVEVIDLTGTGNNTLTLSASDVLAISSTDMLRIDGGAGDVVNAGSGWTPGSQQVIGSNTYDSYAQGLAMLLVDADATLTIG